MKLTRCVMMIMAGMCALLAGGPAFAQGGQPPHPASDGVSHAYELSDLGQRPELLNRERAERAMTRLYPRDLRDQGIVGAVTLRFVIQPDGTVDRKSVQVATSAHVAFNDPAVAVLRTMRFSPGTIDGKPVRVWVTLPIYFSLVVPGSR